MTQRATVSDSAAFIEKILRKKKNPRFTAVFRTAPGSKQGLSKGFSCAWPAAETPLLLLWREEGSGKNVFRAART